jgi:hypothetical protein
MKRKAETAVIRQCHERHLRHFAIKPAQINVHQAIETCP